jgi:hypothetical protein
MATWFIATTGRLGARKPRSRRGDPLQIRRPASRREESRGATNVEAAPPRDVARPAATSDHAALTEDPHREKILAYPIDMIDPAFAS